MKMKAMGIISKPTNIIIIDPPVKHQPKIRCLCHKDILPIKLSRAHENVRYMYKTFGNLYDRLYVKDRSLDKAA